MSRRAELWSIAALIAASLAWHAWSIDRQSLFVDEVCELEVAHRSAAEVWDAPNSMPPLYSFALKGWIGAFGGDGAARWFSALCGVASIFAVWQLGKELAGPAAGVAAAALWAVSPLQLYYSQCIRGYGLFALLVALTTWAYLRARRTDEAREWAAFAALAVLGMFTHYYFAILLAILALDLTVERRGRFSGRAVLAAVAIVILSSPILSCFRTDFQFQRELREARALSPAAAAYTYFSLLSGYTLGPSTAELQSLRPAEAARQAAPWAAALALAAVPLALAGAKHLQPRDRRLVAALLFAPVLVVGLVGAATGLTYNVRHVAWCAIPLFALLGAGVASAGRRRWGAPLAATLAVFMLVADYHRLASPRYQNEDVRAAATWLAEHAATSDVALVIADYMAAPLRYYAPGGPRYVELPVPGELSQVVRADADATTGVEHAREAAPTGGALWLIRCRAFHGDPRGLLFKQLDKAYRFEPVAEFAGIEIYRAAQ